MASGGLKLREVTMIVGRLTMMKIGRRLVGDGHGGISRMARSGMVMVASMVVLGNQTVEEDGGGWCQGCLSSAFADHGWVLESLFGQRLCLRWLLR